MLSSTSRILTYLTAALAAITGAVLFVMPEAMAPVFAWKVSAFMVMTIGAWCLGNGFAALVAAWRWGWSLVHPTLLYLWLFGVLETLVLIAFRDKLVLAHPVAWLYMAMIAVNLLMAVIGFVDWLRLRPEIRVSERIGGVTYLLAWVFVGLVSFLGLYGLFAPMGSMGTSGGIFPEIMTPFTLRAFGAFYLSLGLSAIPIVMHRSFEAMITHAAAAYGLILTISAAMIPYAGLFDLANKPGGLIYIGAYVAVGSVIAVILARHWNKAWAIIRPNA